MILFASQAEFEAWLDENHETSDGVWVKLAKKGSGVASVTYAEAVESALCYGWIDGQARSVDEQFYQQRFTPRTKRSKWSKINRDRVTALIEAGRVKPAGLRQVEAAKADGRWDAAYASPANATVPDDLRAALDANPAAAAFFATLDSRNRYAILHRTQDAKKPETRARRITQFVDMLARGEKLYP
ncbi:MAG TPA: YdeI/OmpD-associated family protein [Actinophytocola sp.]|uniref:YdeI/OmpD-associated family protein n=1 Tax=Actinophytocola sp. TaxID=1872138 RepID=UPI002DDD2E32|nr:YdeI/OmpD-associated family protein [Actinophytocola sp.]HEV2778009.1 YdeI/OmpD-associated family protein [Actinophytocola sp.]